MTWISETPAVARAANEDGDRSRIDGLVPGVATIRARDPETGIQSFPYTLYVLGDLLGIDAYPYDALGDVVRPPGSRRYTAIGRYVGGGTKNLTQELIWHSRDPAIGTAPNQPGDRSRVDSVGPGGTAAIYAEEPTSGLTSNDVIFRVLGELTSLGIRPIARQPPPYNRVPVGAMMRYNVFGVFSTGERLNFARFFPEGYTLVSSDPSIAEVVDRDQVLGVTVGTATIHAVDLASGVESPPQDLLVQGQLARLVASVTLARIPVGGSAVAEATGHFPPGIVLPFRAPLTFSSSNPAVATVTPAGNGRFAWVQGVGPGTATISATDPATGVSSTTSGDDATITVYPDVPPDRIVVTPPVATIPVDGAEDFTATAEFPDGQTLNVTQLAAWTSNAPTVAEPAGTLPPGRSHTVGRGAGVAMLAATWKGVSSTASGHDGIAVVSPVVAFTVLGTGEPLAVGTERDIRVKVLLASGRELNVTNQLEYAALDVGIADFLDPDQRNRVTGIGPGTVGLDIGFPGSSVRTGATLTVVDDLPTTTTSSTTTTTTQPAGSPLVIEPASQAVDFGQTARFRALLDGNDVSDVVEWSVVDPIVASGTGGTLATRNPAPPRYGPATRRAVPPQPPTSVSSGACARSRCGRGR